MAARILSGSVLPALAMAFASSFIASKEPSLWEASQ
jgi:hypothetical protein